MPLFCWMTFGFFFFFYFENKTVIIITARNKKYKMKNRYNNMECNNLINTFLMIYSIFHHHQSYNIDKCAYRSFCQLIKLHLSKTSNIVFRVHCLLFSFFFSMTWAADNPFFWQWFWCFDELMNWNDIE